MDRIAVDAAVIEAYKAILLETRLPAGVLETLVDAAVFGLEAEQVLHLTDNDPTTCCDDGYCRCKNCDAFWTGKKKLLNQ